MMEMTEPWCMRLYSYNQPSRRGTSIVRIVDGLNLTGINVEDKYVRYFTRTTIVVLLRGVPMKPIDGDALIAAIEQMMKYQIDADDICEMIQNFQPIEPERKEGYQLPSAHPEQHEIGYSECASAMLKMWIDNVLTDGEYSRIMDKLNAHWAERWKE